MKKSKRGVTLVELVICCFIIVMLGGACTALLMSGEHIYSTSAEAAGAQLDADVLQTYMMKLVPPSDGVAQATIDEAEIASTDSYLFFDTNNEGKFTIRINGDNTTVDSVSEFKYEIKKAGDSSSPSARAQFVYTVVMSDGSEFTGGFIMSNIPYVEDMITVGSEGYAELESNPVCFTAS